MYLGPMFLLIPSSLGKLCSKRPETQGGSVFRKAPRMRGVSLGPEEAISHGRCHYLLVSELSSELIYVQKFEVGLNWGWQTRERVISLTDEAPLPKYPFLSQVIKDSVPDDPIISCPGSGGVPSAREKSSVCFWNSLRRQPDNRILEACLARPTG